MLRTLRIVLCLWLLSLCLARGLHAQATPVVRNLGASAEVATLKENRLVYLVSETFLGEDLNGDGDREDGVAHVHNLATGETTNLGLVLSSPFGSFSGDWLVFSVSEGGLYAERTMQAIVDCS